MIFFFHNFSSGFGRTTKRLAFPNAQYISDLIKELKLGQKIILVAASMGGSFAFPILLAHPELFAGFVCIAPVGSSAVRQNETLQIPTLLIYGSRDRSCGESCDENLRSIPHYQSVVLEDAGHAAYMNQPDRFHTLLYNFARRVEKQQNRD